MAARDGFIVEGGDISNACLYGNLNTPIIMEQPTDSSCQPAKPGYVCLLQKSMCGLKQAEQI